MSAKEVKPRVFDKAEFDRSIDEATAEFQRRRTTGEDASEPMQPIVPGFWVDEFNVGRSRGQKIKMLCEKTGATERQIVRKAVDEYLKRIEKSGAAPWPVKK